MPNIAPEDPPGFAIRTEAQKAAWGNGFRLERGVDSGWLHYVSTTAHGEIWIAGISPRGPWVLSIDVAALFRPDHGRQLIVFKSSGEQIP